MALDVARLGIAVDSRQVTTGKTELDRLSKAGAKAERQVKKVGAAAATAGRQLSSQNSSLRMASMQLSQVAQQGAATGNYLQALAIQAPDLALGFGAIGIAAGAAIPILYGLAQGIFDTSDELDHLEDAMKEIETAFRDFEGTTDIAMTSLKDLREEYGFNADAVRKLHAELAGLAATRALTAVNDAVAGAADTLGGLEAALAKFSYARREMAQAVDFADGGPGLLKAELQPLEQAVEDAMNAIRDEFGLTTAEAYRIKDALAEINAAGSTEEAAEGARKLSEAIASSYAGSAKIPPEMAELAFMAGKAFTVFSQIEATAGGIAVGIGDGADEAERLKEAAEGIAANLERASQLGLGGGGVVGPDAARQSLYRSGDLGKGNVGIISTYTTPDPKRRGGSSRKAVSEAEREAKAFLRAGLTVERYNEVLQKLNDMHETGEISTAQYTAAIDKLDDRYANVIGSANEFEEINGMLKESILDMATDGVSSLDDLARAIKRAAFEALLFGEGPLAGIFSGGGGSTFGGLLGGLLSFDGGGDTGSGPRSGGLDGKGGFLAMLHPQETVIDHTKQSAGGSTSVVFAPVIDAKGADAAAVLRLERALEKANQEFGSRVVTEVILAQKQMRL